MKEEVMRSVSLSKNNELWLIIGGAGYIGSHIVAEFEHVGAGCVILDLDSNKIRNRIDGNAISIAADICDAGALDSVFSSARFSGVIHLAALKSVEQSLKYPELYNRTNVEGTRNILGAMKKFEINKLLFSSTAAVYGETQHGFVSETERIDPISAYGRTKIQAELLIEEAGREFGLHYVNLRYFNVAGSLNKKLRDDSKDNLIPIVIDKVLNNCRPQIFGNDYPTPDGTAIRDYIHVLDVVAAHMQAVHYLSVRGANETFNIGTGIGTSVLEIVTEILDLMGANLKPEFLRRRDGDIGIVFANPTKAERILGFKAKHSLSEMISSVL